MYRPPPTRVGLAPCSYSERLCYSEMPCSVLFKRPCANKNKNNERCISSMLSDKMGFQLTILKSQTIQHLISEFYSLSAMTAPHRSAVSRTWATNSSVPAEPPASMSAAITKRQDKDSFPPRRVPSRRTENEAHTPELVVHAK